MSYIQIYCYFLLYIVYTYIGYKQIINVAVTKKQIIKLKIIISLNDTLVILLYYTFAQSGNNF